MNHYIIKSEGGIDRVHFRYDTLVSAIKDCLTFTGVASPEVEWYVLSTSRKLVVGHPVGEVPA